QAIGPSHAQVTLTPPVHRSTRKVPRGTISQLVPPVTPVGVPTAGVANPGIPIPGIPIIRSVMVALDIRVTPFTSRSSTRFDPVGGGSVPRLSLVESGDGAPSYGLSK